MDRRDGVTLIYKLCAIANFALKKIIYEKENIFIHYLHFDNCNIL